MESEIAAAVFFLKRLIKLKNTVQEEKIDVFGEKLTTALQEKFEGHWDCDNPNKGQAYRCVRVNNGLRYDPDLLRACRESGIDYSDLGLPWEMTLWVDPGEVCGRYGEENYYFPIATFPNEEKCSKQVSREQKAPPTFSETASASVFLVPKKLSVRSGSKPSRASAQPPAPQQTTGPWRNNLCVPPQLKWSWYGSCTDKNRKALRRVVSEDNGRPHPSSQKTVFPSEVKKGEGIQDPPSPHE